MTAQRQTQFALWLACALAATVVVHAVDSPANEVSPLASHSAKMVLVPAGTYTPLLRLNDEPEQVAVAAFWLDACPVTNGEFLEFLQANPRWRRSAVSRIFADTGYLGHWAGDLELGAGAPVEAPVVRVSWFAAQAFAAWRGCRLPTTTEWERAAGVGFTTDNAATEPAVQTLLAAWFARVDAAVLPNVRQGRPNRLGIHDLHGLIWEWVGDFNAALVTGESRADASTERNLFCGAGSLGARDKSNFPAYLRAGFRSSLRAGYTVPNLGFRCVRSP